MTVAALFVAKGGPYFGLPDVDPWDEVRDARRYSGPHPVVAHPPCERWGRYWSGGPSARERRQLGDDGGCFEAALRAVRDFGGVLEHPEASHAFRTFGLPIPGWRSGWTAPDTHGGRSCCVAQGHYGHRARKLTWLYAVRCSRDLDWSIPPPPLTTRLRLPLSRGEGVPQARRRAGRQRDAAVGPRKPGDAVRVSGHPPRDGPSGRRSQCLRGRSARGVGGSSSSTRPTASRERRSRSGAGSSPEP